MKHTDRTIEITTCGWRHGTPPDGHLVFDLRHHFRDPHVSPELREMTAYDPPVRETVLATPGIAALVDAATAAALAYLAGPTPGNLSIVFFCAGGRHRAAVMGIEVAARLERRGQKVDLFHRDISKAVVSR